MSDNKIRVTYKGETRNIPERYVKGLKGYERRKQIGVNAFLEQKKMGVRQIKQAKQRNTLIKKLVEEGRTQQEIADMIGMDRSIISKILNPPVEVKDQGILS